MASGTTNGLILVSKHGESEAKYNQESNVPQSDYMKAKADGSQSLFVIYDKPNFAAGSASELVESTQTVQFGRPIKSFQGYNKKGLVLFPHPNYCGQGGKFTQSDPDITDAFPPATSEGVSSLIVKEGEWILYSEKNYRGTKIQISGRETFGPGTYIKSGGYDMVQSVKRVQ